MARMICKLEDFRILYIVLLLLAIFQTAVLISSYGSSWQLVEVQAWKPQILAWGFPDSLGSLKHALDWKMFEYEPRLTRPLSNLFELFDTPFIASLWKYAPWPPSLSLTWPFSFVLSPLLLFLLLRRLRVETWITVLAVSLYIANPGVMSLEAMLFRPGKALGNTAILLCLWLAARQEDARRTGVNNSRANLRFFMLCVVVYVSLFFDETALILYPALALFFPRMVFRNSWNIISFALIPVAYVALVKWEMPALSAWAGYPVPNMYGPQDNMTKLLTFQFQCSDYLEVLKGIWPNTRFLLLDSFGLITPRLTHSIFYTCLFILIAVLGTLFLLRLALKLWHDRRKYPKDIFDESLVSLTYRSFLVLTLGLIYEALLMTISLTSVIQMRFWGLFYYGVFNVIFLLIFVASLVQIMRPPKTLAILFTAAVICSTTFIFVATNQVYKDVHYYPYNPIRLLRYFANEENRFDEPRSNSENLRRKTRELWQSAITHQPVKDAPLELSFVLYEIKILSAPIPCKLHYFNLDWQQDKPKITCHD